MQLRALGLLALVNFALFFVVYVDYCLGYALLIFLLQFLRHSRSFAFSLHREPDSARPQEAPSAHLAPHAPHAYAAAAFNPFSSCYEFWYSRIIIIFGSVCLGLDIYVCSAFCCAKLAQPTRSRFTRSARSPMRTVYFFLHVCSALFLHWFVLLFFGSCTTCRHRKFNFVTFPLYYRPP